MCAASLRFNLAAEVVLRGTLAGVLQQQKPQQFSFDVSPTAFVGSAKEKKSLLLSEMIPE